MTQKENIYNIDNILDQFKPPILIVSTVVGRGMYTLGEAVRERFPDDNRVFHIPIEEFLPQRAVDEDLKRYKTISNNFRFLLYIIYNFPFIYYRKYLREKILNASDLHKLKQKIEELNIKTVICISHRAAFWLSNLKRREKMAFRIWDVLGEYGKNLGYKYLFWEQIDGFLSPVDKDILKINFPEQTKFININLPARKEFYKIATTKGDRNKVVLICGFWGQGPMRKILQLLSSEMPQLTIYAICGENIKLHEDIKSFFKDAQNIKPYGIVENLGPFLEKCGCIITKPGISTLLEAHAAGRKIFLLKGMPVAEDNNARFAIKNFGAEWFFIEKLKKWYTNSR